MTVADPHGFPFDEIAGQEAEEILERVQDELRVVHDVVVVEDGDDDGGV